MKMRFIISFLLALVIFIVGMVYTLNQPRIYEARGEVEFSAESESDGKKFSRRVPELTAEEALDILDSASMAMGVTNRLNERERERLAAPYADLKDEKAMMQALYGPDARAFKRIPGTNIIEVVYRHPDPEIAALVANAHMKELIDYSLKLGIDSAMRAVEDLRLRADREKEVIANLANELSKLELNAATASEDELNQIAKVREELKEKRKSYQRIHDEMTTEKTVVSWGAGPIRTVDQAVLPEKHIRPNYMLHLGLSLLAAFLGGAISFIVIGRIKACAA
ncbi:MAG: hypothetical protein R6U56_08575 [Opitutales bacterium]